MISTRIITFGFKDTIRKLGQIKRVMTNVDRTDLRRMGQIALDDVQDHFDKSGPGWRHLAPSTLAKRARLGQGTKILVISEALKKGSRYVTTINGFNIVSARGKAEPYIYAQNFGTDRIPARKFWYLSLSAINRIVDVPTERLIRTMRAK